MNRDKQIEEMAKDLQETHDYDGCEAWHCGGCEYEKYGKNKFCSSIKQAEKMTAKGYRKASELFEEIVAIIEQRKAANAERYKGVQNEVWQTIYKAREHAYNDIKEIIEQKYTEGEG